MNFKGNISIKKIKGKDYYTHQYRDGDKVKNISLSKEEAYSLMFNISYSKKYDLDELNNHVFKTEIQYSNRLYGMFAKYSSFKHRYMFDNITSYLSNDKNYGKVLALFGLRRTGKTTLIFQSIINLSIQDFAKSVYIKVNNDVSFYDLMDDLAFLTDHGFKYIFIDEVTLLKDFSNLASVLSDIYGLKAKIVLSGTDSLGFVISKYHELYDRIILLHTTYISYKEFSEVLGIDSIDTYIEYGGLMSVEGVNYNEQKILGGETVNEYVDSAIAHNIEHSLKYYKEGEHFASLHALIEKGELTNAINRIVEDSNHRFAIEVINRAFTSHDLGSLKNLIKKNKDTLIASSLDNLDEEKVVSLLMESLSIIDKEKQTHKIDETVIKEIDAYLDLLDLCKEIDVVMVPSFQIIKKKVFIQPGLRYAQAKALLDILMKQPKILSLPIYIKTYIENKLLSDIKGKLLEEIVLYQSFVTNKDTFKLMFPIGEIDMVKLDNQERASDIFEVKYTKERNPLQYRFLNSDEYLDVIYGAYYPIRNKVVLYRGDTCQIEDIKYINVCEYLKGL